MQDLVEVVRICKVTNGSEQYILEANVSVDNDQADECAVKHWVEGTHGEWHYCNWKKSGRDQSANG